VLVEVISLTPAIGRDAAPAARHAGRHGFGARARQRRLHQDGREVDLRQRRHRQPDEREQARERDAEREQRRRDGAVMNGRDRFIARTGPLAGAGAVPLEPAARPAREASKPR
jgi:hypothetical protein